MAKAAEKTAPKAPTLNPSIAGGQVSEMPGSPSMIPSALVETITRESAPAMVPPSEEVREEAMGEGITAWYSGKKITALWSDSANRNSWIAIDGIGWRKLANLNDSAVVSMTLLASHAEQTGATVNVRIEADNMVHEIYVW